MILVAPDKFKGSLTARQVCAAITEALLILRRAAEVVSIPLADGGEGTADLLTEFTKGQTVRIKVKDPLFRPIESQYGISGDGTTAFIEMAKASGLQLLTKEERNPLITSTFGTGQLIADALDRNVSNIILGVGGSATNDGGMGMAQALGFQFVSADNEILEPVGQHLIHVEKIKQDRLHPRLNNCRFTTLHDVKNPLCGKHGAAAVFAEQKGASPDAIQLLDLGLAHFANVVLKQFKLDVNFPGAGAGGGIAAMAKLALNSSFIPGIDFILDFTHLEHYLQNASLVITGEGKIDEQTLSGKVVKGVATFCAKYNKPCIAFTGTSTITHDQTKRLGLQEIIALVDAATSEPEAVREAYSILKLKAVRSLPRWLT